MLFLILSDWHEVSMVKENISSHQCRIGKEARRDVLALPCTFIFKLSHSTQLTHVYETIKDPSEFSMLRNMGLNKESRSFWVDASSKVGGQSSISLLS